MTTIINNPGEKSDGSTGIIIGVVLVALILGALFFIYGIPGVDDRGGNDDDVNINVPDEIQVNVPNGNDDNSGSGNAGNN